MVGFGSSLRLARRVGWEGAYLDYETLKLLLSQIEAVYETAAQDDGGQRSSDSQNDMFVLDNDNRDLIESHRRRRRQRRQDRHHQSSDHPPRTYKEEIFLESDSDLAYLSVVDTNDDDDNDNIRNSSTSEEEAANNSIRSHHAPAVVTQPFALPYSHENVSSSSSDDSRRKRSGSSLCWGGTRTRTTTTAKSGVSGAETNHELRREKRSKEQRRKHRIRGSTRLPVLSDRDDDAFYNRAKSSTSATNGFYMAEMIPYGEEDIYLTRTTDYYPDEGTSLLSTAGASSSPKNGKSLSPLAGDRGSLSPPSLAPFPSRQNLSSSITPLRSRIANNQAHVGGGELHPHMKSGPTFLSPAASYSRQPLQQQLSTEITSRSQPDHTCCRRKHSSRNRTDSRKKQQLKRRLNALRHLRVAHSKARAITERFLGLLRAETEKVMLFAQSRLGELADTAGSLRFPSFDEEYAANTQQHSGQHQRLNSNKVVGSTYEFDDGGMHPSASSSSDDGTGGARNWTDSSDDEGEDNSNAAGTKPNNTAYVRMSGMQFQSSRSGLAGGPANLTMSNSLSGGGLSDDTPTIVTARTKDLTSRQLVRRQIAHFEALRKNRAIFQRSEQILGEDMLFLSAVEETDGYTAVGVELMHVLKYICVNLIAVRKICRKHDRLLMNRMLGGYYKRVRTRGGSSSRNSVSYSLEGIDTLGGMVARISGDIYEAHPALIGQMNHYKLVGVYDKKIQKLANSRTVQAVSSCLALSLSEYEVARSRADALTMFNAGTSVESRPTRKRASGTPLDVADDASIDDPPSTASTISLTRLRFTVMSIFALREVARSKLEYFANFLSRATLSYSGLPVAGEGLDGCSRETLDFVVAYDPDAALLRDSSLLYDGIQKDKWSRKPLADVMLSTLAVATIPADLPTEIASEMLPNEEAIVARAVSALPELKRYKWMGLNYGRLTRRRRHVAVKKTPPVALQLTRWSLFLYAVNYFMAHATTAVFVNAVPAPSSYSAIIIGAPNLSAGIVACIHCWHSAQTPSMSQCRFSPQSIRQFLIIGSAMGMVGNAVHAYGLWKSSVIWSIAGRLCLGFSASDILQRGVIASCVPFHVVSESARLALSKIGGMVAGFILGTAMSIVMDFTAVNNTSSLHARQLRYASWLMALLWFIQLVYVHIMIPRERQESVTGSSSPASVDPLDTHETTVRNAEQGHRHDSDSDSSSSAHIGTPSSVLYGNITDDMIVEVVASVDFWQSENKPTPPSSNPLRKDESRLLLCPKPRQWKSFSRLRKLFAYHVGISVTLLVYVFATFALEVFFTATPLIAIRYFSWTGGEAGTLLSCLTTCILPILFVAEIIVRRYEERTILKRTLGYICLGLLIMINWESMFSVAKRGPNLFADINGGRSNHPYDWEFGVFQYTGGLAIVFVGCIAVEMASLSLLSKVSPPTSSSSSTTRSSIMIHVSTIVTFLGLAARFMGNVEIVAVDLSHKLINTDIVNSLVLPLLVTSILLRYLIRKHFFFLM